MSHARKPDSEKVRNYPAHRQPPGGWRRAIHGMLTRSHAEIAGTIARQAMEGGRLVQVCAHCQPEEMRAALEGLPNVSHGICEPCLAAEIEEMRAALVKTAPAMAEGRAA